MLGVLVGAITGGLVMWFYGDRIREFVRQKSGQQMTRNSGGHGQEHGSESQRPGHTPSTYR